MLSDENDCSLQVGGQTWVFVNLDDARPIFRGSSTCEQDPNAKCCYSCPLSPPAGCATDPVCTADVNNVNRLTPQQDGQGLRCYDQQRRFGYDVLYPVQRYVNALTRFDLCWNAPDLSTDGCAQSDIVPNPLYASGRTPAQVLLAGLVGVPWQALASNVDAAARPLPASELRYKSAAEMNAQGDGTWAQIVGSPGVRWRAARGDQPEITSVPRVAPTLPQMVESEFTRPGVVAGNALNGRDYDTSFGRSTPDDLQFACVFPLSAPVDCAARNPNYDNCDCFEGEQRGPLCEQTPGVSATGTTQYWAGARPGTRELEVLQGFGAHSVVASACPRNTSDATLSDFGYRPAIDALLEQVQAISP
jgi:hypothetical protein